MAIGKALGPGVVAAGIVPADQYATLLEATTVTSLDNPSCRSISPLGRKGQ